MKIPLFAALVLLTGSSAWTQTSFDNDRLLAPGLTPLAVLTEGFPLGPTAAISYAAMGLGPGDDIASMSLGDDTAIMGTHAIIFSVSRGAFAVPGSGVDFETVVDTPPGLPPSAAGDLFMQDPGPLGNILAPPGLGYEAGTMDGDEFNATFFTGCGPGVVCADLDAFDHSDPAGATGVYFTLAAGSPTLLAIPAGPGDILYSELSGVLPVIAVLGGGAGLATAANLGVPPPFARSIDALNVVGTTGSVGSGGGVITPGAVGPSITGTIAPSTHLLEFSVLSFTLIDVDVLVRSGPGVSATHTPGPVLGLGGGNINALEAVCPPAPAGLFSYNGTGINLDSLATTPVVVGSPWTATVTTQLTRGPGAWIVLVRSSPASVILDWGTFFSLPTAGVSELLVGAGFIANVFTTPAHLGFGSSASVTVSIPASCALVGAPWYAQSLVLGDLPAGAGIFDPWWSSATGGTVGTF